MNYKEAVEEIEKVVDDLIEENKRIPLLVEGDKDVAALRKLGVIGVIIRVNTGKTLSDFCDFIASRYEEIIILTDWDRRGGILCARIKRNLEGRVKCNTRYREMLAKLTTIRTIEGLPSWIKSFKKRFSGTHSL
ncbi:MAG TPA: topoisomerase [Thermoplasmatales archaeon]|nr:topoisomerase [Thermoplasmatales archaeon]